jgi:uncharacterized protein YndB with AHSA1/START domain
MKLEAKASIQIQKPARDVFEGIVNPGKMTKYFISESNGRIESGKEVIWKFPEFDNEFPVKAINILPGKKISFVWGPDTNVNISLEQ